MLLAAKAIDANSENARTHSAPRRPLRCLAWQPGKFTDHAG